MKMDLASKILSELIISMKYSRFLPDKKRRETWSELIDRNRKMHQKKYPALKKEIADAFQFVYDKKVLPSMRSLQFGGKPIEISPSRIYNCCYAPIDDWQVFSEIMFLLLGGSGVGYSVQKHHVERLPVVRKPLKRCRRYLIGDSIEGWADAIKMLMKAYFFGKSDPQFDFSDIRSKGTRLVTSGGKAPGPQPLKDCIHNIRKVLDAKEAGEKLCPIEAHDIVCHIADAVLSGGIRRAALISLFSFDDEQMMTSKYGSWWELNPQRARANNSAVILRHRIKETEFYDLWEKMEMSGCGEPAFYFTNDMEMGTNPCGEVALRNNQFCNLVTINAASVESQEDLEERATAAAFIGTLQAGYTNFHYLRDIWQQQTEKEALLGISLTGIASNRLKGLQLKQAVAIALAENKRVANLMGIRYAARVTAIKPEGTSSLVLGTSSGIHAWYNDFYLRRLRVNKDEPVYLYLKEKFPELLEDDFEKPHMGSVISIPIKAPEGAILRKESALSLLKRIKYMNRHWIRPGHIRGNNRHNVSATVSVKENEWDRVGRWAWENRDYFNGLTVMPYDGGNYVQMPLEDIEEEEYKKLVKYLKEIKLSEIEETEDRTTLSEEVACSGGSCEITQL